MSSKLTPFQEAVLKQIRNTTYVVPIGRCNLRKAQILNKIYQEDEATKFLDGLNNSTSSKKVEIVNPGLPTEVRV